MSKTCIRHDVFPTFVRFKVANRNLHSSSTRQKRLLNAEFINKNECTQRHKAKVEHVIYKVKAAGIVFGFGIYSIITNGNEVNIELVKVTTSKKLEKLISDCNNHGTNIFNFSSHVLTSSQNSLLSKGLNVAIPLKFLRYEDYLLPFEMLFRNIVEAGKLPEDNKLFFKNNLMETCFSSFRNYNKSRHKYENITEDEFNALLELKNLKNIIIQKSDKGNSVVLINNERQN